MNAWIVGRRRMAPGARRLAATPSRRWVCATGLAACVLAVIGFRGQEKVRFAAALGIPAINVVLFAAGGEALT